MPKRLALIILVLLNLQACNSKQVFPTELPTLTPKPPIVLPSPAVPSPTLKVTPTIIPTQVPATQTTFVEVPLDPCKLVPQSSVEAILGEPSQVTPDTGVCVYAASSGSRSISIQVGTGEEVKLVMLNNIAQLRAGCTLNINYSSEQPTATPFPPEIQELAGRSLVELMALQDEAFLECGWADSEELYQTINGLGDSANFMMLDLAFWKLGTVSVALGETYLSFTMVAQELDPAVALNAGLTLAQEALESLR